MTDFTRGIDERFPTYEEVDAIMREARSMRARAMLVGAASIWSMLQRVVTQKPAPAKTYAA